MPAIESLPDAILPKLRQHGAAVGKILNDWILDLVAAPEVRVNGARQAATWLNHELETQRKSSAEQIRGATMKLDETKAALSEACHGPKMHGKVRKNTLTPRLLEYARLVHDHFVWEGVCKTVSVVEAHITRASDQLRDLWKDINQLVAEFESPVDPSTELDVNDAAQTGRLTESWSDEKWNLVEQLDHELETNFFADDKTLPQILAQGGESRVNLVSAMRVLARKVLVRSNKAKSLADMTEVRNHDHPTEPDAVLRGSLQSSLPTLLEVVGAKRLMLVTPQGFDAALLNELLHRVEDDPTIVHDPHGGFAVGYEVEDLPLESVFTLLMRCKADCQELAARLHTRTDIEWPTIYLVVLEPIFVHCQRPDFAAEWIGMSAGNPNLVPKNECRVLVTRFPDDLRCKLLP